MNINNLTTTRTKSGEKQIENANNDKARIKPWLLFQTKQHFFIHFTTELWNAFKQATSTEKKACTERPRLIVTQHNEN